MNSVKDNMYNYETTPPVGVWEAIASQLDGNEARIIPLTKKNNRRFYYMAAASLAVIILAVVFFTLRTSQSGAEGFFSFSTDKQTNTSLNNKATDTTSTPKNDNVVITVPDEEKNIQNDTEEELTAKNTIVVKGGPHEKIKNEEVKNNDSVENTSNNKTLENKSENKVQPGKTVSAFMTIEGPQGQPLKVSSKLATLIDSSDNKVPPKPSWNRKINEWREIMKGNTLAPTPGNFLDIIELTKALKDNKKP